MLDAGTISDLEWWIGALDSWNGAAAPSRKIDLQVTSDASAAAWGGHCQDMDAQGFSRIIDSMTFSVGGRLYANSLRNAWCLRARDVCT